MEPRQIGRVARQLAGRQTVAPSREALERSAVSRYYFEAHHHACLVLAARGHMIPRRGRHLFVITHLETYDRMAVETLAALNVRRNFADYDIDDRWRGAAIGEAEAMAEQILAVLSSLG